MGTDYSERPLVHLEFSYVPDSIRTYSREGAVCPQLKKTVIILLLLTGTVLLLSDGDVFSRLALS